MDDMIAQIFQVCIIPLLAILTKYTIDYINAKREQIKQSTKNETEKKYADMIADTITKCVVATNQTYVDSLKEHGSFNKEAQEYAFQNTLNAVIDMLPTEAIRYVEEITDDVRKYLAQLIEAEIPKQKIKREA